MSCFNRVDRGELVVSISSVRCNDVCSHARLQYMYTRHAVIESLSNKLPKRRAREGGVEQGSFALCVDG